MAAGCNIVISHSLNLAAAPHRTRISVSEIGAMKPGNAAALATAVYNRASLEDIEGAAPAALVIVLISLVAVVIVSLANSD